MVKFTAIVLAAGKGKRMKSSLPKVLQNIRGKPLIFYILRELLGLKKHIKQIIIVVGYKGELVEEEVRNIFSSSKKTVKIEFVYQRILKGTADALKYASKKIEHTHILVTCGDAPLITKKTLSAFLSFSLRQNLTLSLIAAYREEKNDLGKVVRDDKGKIQCIKEKGTKGIGSLKEVNSGMYIFKRAPFLAHLGKIKMNKKKKEYYLTDIVEIFYTQGYKMNVFQLEKDEEILGINDFYHLALAERIMQRRILDKHLKQGVRIFDLQTTFVEEGVKIGKNTVIYPFTFIRKDVIIGSNCSIGPFVHLRERTRIKDNTHLGNFLEICRSRIGNNTKIKHFGYFGDAVVGNNVNIGAGTVVANFDGTRKHTTSIKNGAFIGADTILVAPVTVGKASVTGAGSVVRKNVDASCVVVGTPARFLKKISGDSPTSKRHVLPRAGNKPTLIRKAKDR